MKQPSKRPPVDQIEVRTLPAARAHCGRSAGIVFRSFQRAVQAALQLYQRQRYLDDRTVEGQLDSAQMRFYLGQDAPDAPRDTDAVRVIEVPSRMVASIGGSGSYGESNVGAARQRLESWLADQEQWGRRWRTLCSLLGRTVHAVVHEALRSTYPAAATRAALNRMFQRFPDRQECTACPHRRAVLDKLHGSLQNSSALERVLIDTT